MSARSICLLGRDYPELGPLGLAALPDGGGLALSRGALPKAYAHEDPNEDGVLLVRTAEGVLLAAADGYNGVNACEVALGLTREHAERLVAASDAAFRLAVCDLLEQIHARLRRKSRSRTCLLIASLRGNHCDVACFGDSALFRASEAMAVTPANDLVLGGRGFVPGEPLDLWYRGFERDPGERVALVTDGVTNFVRRLSHVSKLLGEAPDDLSAARAIVAAAMEGGAGDNLAVATIALPDTI